MTSLDLVGHRLHTIRIPQAHSIMHISDAIFDTAGTSTSVCVKTENIRPRL